MSTEETWEDRFPNMKPISKPPSLSTINGIGFTVLFSRDYDEETGTYVKTRFFSLIFIPLLALDAWRVADAPGQGWYFLGKEPLSGGAKRWNAFFTLCVLALIGGIWRYNHVTSPEYVAGQKMAQAQQHEQKNEVVAAAKLYKQVIDVTPRIRHTDPAIEKLNQLLKGSKDVPLKTTAEVYAQLVGWQPSWSGMDNLFTSAKELLQKRGAEDPEGGLELLSQVEAVAPSLEDVAILKEPLLEAQVKADPEDVDLLIELCLVYEARNQLPKCEPRLLPHRDKLGTTEGARILGQALARKKDQIEQADALLIPYVQANMDRLKEAFEEYGSVRDQIVEQVREELRNGTAPATVLDDLKNAQNNPDEGRRIVGEYLTRRFRNSKEVAATELELQKANRIVEAVMVLGVNRTMRAQQMEAEQKTKELEKAEKTFLSIREVAEGRGDFKLYLGRVYYWMGKEDQGQGLFDELLESTESSTSSVLAVGNVLREVGARAKARELVEQTYEASAIDEDRHKLASLRALLGQDLDDQITWLERCDLKNDDSSRATLHDSRSRKAWREGDAQTAKQEVELAVAVYDGMVKSQATYNNSALAYSQLFTLTGDLSALEKAQQRLRKAYDLQRDHPITLSNLAHQLEARGIREVSGKRIDFQALRAVGGLFHLKFLYSDQAGHQTMRKQLQENPAFRESQVFLQRLTVISPKNVRPYLSLAYYQYVRRDLENLKRTLQKVEVSTPDLTDYVAGKKSALAGEDVEKGLLMLDVEEKRLRVRMASLDPKSEGLTASIAKDLWISVQLARAKGGRKVDVDTLVSSAEKNYKDHPSAQTGDTLIDALIYRARRALEKQDAAFRQMCDRLHYSLGSSSLLAIALESDDPVRELALKNADVKRACELIHEEVKRFPTHPRPWAWAMLRHTHPEVAKQVAERIGNSELSRVYRQLRQMLTTMEGSVAMEGYWAQASQGEQEKGKEVLKQFADRGVPLPKALLK